MQELIFRKKWLILETLILRYLTPATSIQERHQCKQNNSIKCNSTLCDHAAKHLSESKCCCYRRAFTAHNSNWTRLITNDSEEKNMFLCVFRPFKSHEMSVVRLRNLKWNGWCESYLFFKRAFRKFFPKGAIARLYDHRSDPRHRVSELSA